MSLYKHMIDMYTLKQDHNLNKLGEAPPGEVTYEKSRLYALWDREVFLPKNLCI